MAKAYWISCYRAIKNPEALAAYAKLAGPALTAQGGMGFLSSISLLSVFVFSASLRLCG